MQASDWLSQQTCDQLTINIESALQRTVKSHVQYPDDIIIISVFYLWEIQIPKHYTIIQIFIIL